MAHPVLLAALLAFDPGLRTAAFEASSAGDEPPPYTLAWAQAHPDSSPGCGDGYLPNESIVWTQAPLESSLVGRGLVPRLESTGAPPEQEDVPSLLRQVDEQWKRRDEPGGLDRARALLAEAERAAPDDYGVLWRLAQLDFWLSDDPALGGEEKSRLGKKAWEYGDRASAVNPNRVEGWYFAAVGMGNYSLGIGILKALGQGLEGKFKERLSRAERIAPNFYAGGIYNAWGRFYFKLPWPKYDPRRSERLLLKGIEVNPDNVRGRVFLAELYEKEGRATEARSVLEQALAHRPGSYDAPEERRSQKRARELLAGLKH